MSFSRATEIEIHFDIDIEFDAGLYPIDGDDQIKAAIVVFGDAQKAGRDVDPSAVGAACHTVAGVLAVTLLQLDTSTSPVATIPIPIDTRELAVYDTSRIVINSSERTP